MIPHKCDPKWVRLKNHALKLTCSCGRPVRGQGTAQDPWVCFDPQAPKMARSFPSIAIQQEEIA